MTNENEWRTRCLIYTRVMGYLSPCCRYNIGKKSEFYSRVTFSKKKALEKCWYVKEKNDCFIKQYGNKEK